MTKVFLLFIIRGQAISYHKLNKINFMTCSDSNRLRRNFSFQLQNIPSTKTANCIVIHNKCHQQTYKVYIIVISFSRLSFLLLNIFLLHFFNYYFLFFFRYDLFVYFNLIITIIFCMYVCRNGLSERVCKGPQVFVVHFSLVLSWFYRNKKFDNGIITWTLFLFVFSFLFFSRYLVKFYYYLLSWYYHYYYVYFLIL